MTTTGQYGGTIRGREVRQVVCDLMARRNVPRGVWSISPRGILHILVGTRLVEIECPSGQAFYRMQSLIAKIERTLDDRDLAVVYSRQVDIEDTIRAAAP